MKKAPSARWGPRRILALLVVFLLGAQLTAVLQRSRTAQTAQTGSALDIALRERVDADNNVILILGNFGQADFILNQLCSMRKVGIDGRVVVVSTDAQAQAELATHGVPSLLGSTLQLRPVAIEAQTFGTLPYNQIVNLKTRVVLAILERGYNVLLCDTDIVFMRSPFPALMADTKADIVFQHGNPPPTGREGKEISAGNYKNHNTGFYYSRSSPRTVAFFKQVVERQSRLGAKEHDQFLINQILAEGNHSVRDVELSKTMFPNGAWFFWKALPEMKDVCPVILHVNYIPGHTLKKRHLKLRAVWELDGDLRCLDKSPLDESGRCPK